MVCRTFFLFLFALILACPSMAGAKLPDYVPSRDIQQGQLTSVGSDTLRIVMERWSEAFNRFHPGISFTMESKGSATAPGALTSGRSTLAPMSREMTKEEIAAFKAKYRYEPVAIKVAIDALAIYVNKDNPIRGLTLKQLDGIFSQTNTCGANTIKTWGDLVYGPLSKSPVLAYGRNKLSGTHAVFKKVALCGGQFSTQVKSLEDSKAVINAVANDINAIGYSGLGYRTQGVRPISVGRNPDGPFYPFFVEKYKEDPDFEKRYQYVVSGDYPLARNLYIYVNKPPKETLPPLEEAFIRLVLSAQGQQIIHDIGYIPLPVKTAARQLKKLSADYKPSWWQFND